MQDTPDAVRDDGMQLSVTVRSDTALVRLAGIVDAHGYEPVIDARTEHADGSRRRATQGGSSAALSAPRRVMVRAVRWCRWRRGG